MTDPRFRYQHRIRGYQHRLERLEKSFNLIFYLKIALIFGELMLAAFLFVLKFYLGIGLCGVAGVLFFILLDIRHHKVQERQKATAILKQINEQSLERLDGRWNSFPDSGEDFRDEQHPFAADLDIFGRNSLFQWINTAQTFLGRQKLAGLITAFPEPSEAITKRQKAIEELAHSLTWRQHFVAYGILADGSSPATRQEPAFLFRWAAERNPFFTFPPVIFLIRFLTGITITTLLISLGLQRLPFYIPLFLLLVQLILLKIGRKRRESSLVAAAGYQKNLALFKDLLAHIEDSRFHCVYLKSLQERITASSGARASAQLRRLEKIVDAIANRNNFFYAFVNVMTLWDYHCFCALEVWKAEAGEYLETWLGTLGHFEALASLAIINHDHPGWIRPVITNEPHFFNARKLGHPLLPETRRVANDIGMDSPTQVLMITGSNMSGKSTYLRTAGINLVLAYAGVRVCAAECRCSPMRVYTCMRVSDNLEQNISTFYAEILRIKQIVAAATVGPVFFLLDEIFKGTNSLDRHTGAKILIKKLIRHGAVGLVSTHDLELGGLAQESATVRNYHFQEIFQNNQLYFDYQLHPGISTTRNALQLLRLAGIEPEQE